MPVTYGRPRPATTNPTLSLEPTPRINSPTSRSPSPEFRQSWKDDLAAIDNNTYAGEVVHEPKGSSLTPLVSLSSLAPTDSQQQAEPLPRSSPPSSPAPAYRDPDHTDDPDTSIELNTTLTGPSSDVEDQQMADSAEVQDDDSDEEPAVRRRSGKPLRVLESDSEEEENGVVSKPTGTSGVAHPTASASSRVSSGNNLSQFSLDRPDVRSSTATTPASVPRKPIKLALSDDEESDENEADGGNQDGIDPIEAASSPNLARSTRNKGLNKAEKVEMAKTQQKIAGSRDIIIPNASKRIDAKALFSSYSASLPNQDEIDSYPFPPGAHPRRTGSQRLSATQKSTLVLDPKASLRNKLAMLPLSAHVAPAPRASLATPSDPILGSSQSHVSVPGNDADEDGDEEEGQEGMGMGRPTVLGALMFGAPKSKAPMAGGDVFGPGTGSDEELPAASSLFGSRRQGGTNPTLSLAEKKRQIAAQQPVQSDSDSDLDLEITSQKKIDKGKNTTARILVRPGEGQGRSARKPVHDVVTDSQVERAGHAVHFGRDAEQLGSSPVRGGGVYEESQFGRAPLVGSGSGSAMRSRPKPVPRKSAGGSNLTLEQLKRHAASRAQLDGQLKQRADETRWKNSGGRERVAREGGVSVEDVVRRAVLGGDAEKQYEEEDEEDEEDEDYRGSASDSDGEEEDKENLPASGRARKPHEPVSDLDGSGGDEEADADADKENSLELRGIGGRSPAGLNGRSPALLSGGLSPAHLGALSPSRLSGMSPGHLFARSPSHLHPHSRVSSSGSGRLPLSELGDEDAAEGDAENAAVARAPLGELEVEREGYVQEEDEEEIIRRPTKRARSSVSRRLFDEDEEGDKGENAGGSRLSSAMASRRMSPSQRLLGSPSQRRLGSPSQRLLTPSSRFRSPPSRLRSPLPPTGTQSFTQVETQAMLGGLGDMFGFETQAPPGENKEDGEDEETGGGGGLTQLFAKAEVGTSSAFAALRTDANTVELTQDDRSKLLYRPVLRDEELRRDQDLFEREDELMAQPFSPTQREKGTQRWLNERGLWTQTRPAQTQADLPGLTPMPQTQQETTSPLASPVGSLPGRRRIVRRGVSKEDSSEVKVPSLLDMLRGTQSMANKDKKKKKKLGRSEFVEGEAAESDDEYGDFGPRLRKEDEEGDEDDDRHLEELVDDQAMDEDMENAAQVQAKYLEQNAEDDARREKIAREVVAGKTRNRRRGRGDNMDLDDDDESEDDGYNGPKKLLKKRKIENDGLEGLEKHESTRAFVATYNKGIKSADDEEFQHLNKVTDDPRGGAPDLDEDEDAQSGESVDEDEEEDREQDVEEREIATPFRLMQKVIPSSAPAEIAFGMLDESDEEPTFDLPDAVTRPSAVVARPSVTNVARMKTWVAQEGNSRGGPVRSGQGASVTGHNNKNKFAKPKSTTATRPAAPVASSASSGMLGRLGKKFSGFE